MSWITDQDAPHFNIPDEYVLADQKATPVDADRVLLEDSEDGFTKKYAELGDLPGGGGGSVDVEDDNVFVAAADTLNFGSNLTVTDDGGGKVTVDASGGGGGGNAAYAETIGDNTNTTYTVTHNLGTTDLVVQLWDLTGTDPVEATGDASSIEAVSVNAIDVTFAAAPPVDSYRVVILSDGGTGGGGMTVQVARIETTQGTTSDSFTDLATAGPAVTITVGASGLLVVNLGCRANATSAGNGALMGFDLSGANTLSADPGMSVGYTADGSNAASALFAGRTFTLTGLSTGATTVTAKYRRISGGTANFREREVSAWVI